MTSRLVLAKKDREMSDSLEEKRDQVRLTDCMAIVIGFAESSDPLLLPSLSLQEPMDTRDVSQVSQSLT